MPYAFYSRTAEALTGGDFTHYIGEQFGGGIIFHLWKDESGAEHGLVVSLTHTGMAEPWSNITNNQIGNNAQSTWDGLANSYAIVGQAGHTGSAAKLCLDLDSGGYNDWYLPSIDELNLLLNNRYHVNKTLSSMGGGAVILPLPAYYWSSVEANSTHAWFYNYGSIAVTSKSSTYYVRAIRAF